MLQQGGRSLFADKGRESDAGGTLDVLTDAAALTGATGATSCTAPGVELGVVAFAVPGAACREGGNAAARALSTEGFVSLSKPGGVTALLAIDVAGGSWHAMP